MKGLHLILQIRMLGPTACQPGKKKFHFLTLKKKTKIGQEKQKLLKSASWSVNISESGKTLVQERFVSVFMPRNFSYHKITHRYKVGNGDRDS